MDLPQASSVDVRLVAVQGMAHAAVGRHHCVARLLLPLERAFGRHSSITAKRRRATSEVRDEGRECALVRPRECALVDGRTVKHQRLSACASSFDGCHQAHSESFGEGHMMNSASIGDSDISTRELAISTVCLEKLLGAPRRVRVALALSSALAALGRHSLACAISVRLLEEMRTCMPTRAEYYVATASDEVARLRISCARAAHACGEWDVAHSQLRALCLAHPAFDLNWALSSAVSGRARSRGYDERWLLRLLIREPTSAPITAGVAHHCFLSRSFKIALVEYTRLHQRMPSEPLLRLCVAVSQMQLVMSRANKDRGASALYGFAWMDAYAKIADEQEAHFNTARAYHHLGLSHLALNGYERVLELSRRCAADGAVSDLAHEAAHNAARIFCASGNRALARCVVRSTPVV